MVCVFARKTSEPLASLVKQIDKKIGENGKLKSFVVIVPKKGDKPRDDLKKLAKDAGIKHVPLTIGESPDGPPDYELAKDADITVLMWKQHAGQGQPRLQGRADRQGRRVHRGRHSQTSERLRRLSPCRGAFDYHHRPDQPLPDPGLLPGSCYSANKMGSLLHDCAEQCSEGSQSAPFTACPNPGFCILSSSRIQIESGLLDCRSRGKRGCPDGPRISGSVTQGKEASMRYDKDQAAAEFTRWSENYDRCVLQWMLFGPSHRVLIRRIAAVAEHRPFRLLDVGCGTGLFATRLKAALPQAEVCGVDLVSGMLSRGRPRWEYHAGEVFPVREIASGCRSDRAHSTSSHVPTVFTTIRSKTVPCWKCNECCDRADGCC